MTRILCAMEDCIYCVDKGKSEGIYRFQCGNDEVEIDLSAEGRPCCYSYEKRKLADNVDLIDE